VLLGHFKDSLLVNANITTAFCIMSTFLKVFLMNGLIYILVAFSMNLFTDEARIMELYRGKHHRLVLIRLHILMSLVKRWLCEVDLPWLIFHVILKGVLSHFSRRRKRVVW
jgi:hypothetical protein